MTKESKMNYKFTKPNYLKMLCDKVDNFTKVAEMIGSTCSTVSCAIADNKCTEIMENAAMGVWVKKFEKKAANSSPLMILTVDPAHHTTIQSLVKNLGGQVLDLDSKIAAAKGSLAL